MATPTSIQVSPKMRRRLKAMKMHPRESYEEVIERLLEDLAELNEETLRDIEKAKREIAKGGYKTQAEVRRELGL